MRTIHVLLSLPGIALTASCSPEQPSAASSFDVTATLSFIDEPSYGVQFPESERFVLRLDDAPTGP